MKHNLETMYLDWVNNFLTLEVFANYYGISMTRAFRIIELGRKLNHRR